MSASIIRAQSNKSNTFWILAFLAVITFVFLFYFHAVNHSKTITDFITVINKNEKIVEYFGPNITKKGKFGMLSIKKIGTLSGKKVGKIIEINIRLQGDKRAGKIVAQVEKVNGTYALVYFAVQELDGDYNEIIDLIFILPESIAKKVNLNEYFFDLDGTIELLLAANEYDRSAIYERKDRGSAINFFIEVDANGDKTYHLYHSEGKTGDYYASTKSLAEFKKVWHCYISGSDEFKTYLNWVAARDHLLATAKLTGMVTPMQ